MSTAAPATTRLDLSRKLGLLLLVVGLVLAYWPTFYWLRERYRAPGTLYSHGPLVPLVSAFLIYRSRALWRPVVGPGSWWALGFVIPTLVLHWAAVRLRFDSPSGFTMLLLIPALVWLLWGRRLLARIWFPCVFLGFAIPLPLIAVHHAAQMLKSIVIAATTGLLTLFRTGIEASGPYLLLPEGGRLLIDDECSGLRSLVALIALGVLMAGTARDVTPLGRLMLLAAAVPIALFANLCRVLFLCLVGLWWGVPAAASAHDPSGYGVYAVAIVAYVLLDRWARRGTAREATS